MSKKNCANENVDGKTRHLMHNVELKAQRHIREYGGYQWDLFQDNDTGEPRTELFPQKAA
jgi:hypothetical protein